MGTGESGDGDGGERDERSSQTDSDTQFVQRTSTGLGGSLTGSRPTKIDLETDGSTGLGGSLTGNRPSQSAVSAERPEEYYGMSVPNEGVLQRLRANERMYGDRVHDWVDEGMPTDIMGKTNDMKAFRKRQAERPDAVPTDIERQNAHSVQRSAKAAADTSPAGDTGVPDSVRSVVSSNGQSLDGDIKDSMESRMGASFDDVQVHAGPQAAAACEDIDARAFTVGNHVAFNHGEYDPASPEGQHVIAHELAHVRQQTGGAVSMLPQEDGLQVDPDPALEREAEETAQRVMKGGDLGIQRLADTDVHVQRLDDEDPPSAFLDDSGSDRFTLTASVGEDATNKPRDVARLRRRLVELGYDWVDDSPYTDGACDPMLIRAIRLVESIVDGDTQVVSSGIDADRSGDEDVESGRIEPGGETYQWLRAANAPEWQEMPSGRDIGGKWGGLINAEVLYDTDDDHQYGTGWLAETIVGAAELYHDNHESLVSDEAGMYINDTSKPMGHDTPDHAGHEAGLTVDVLVPAKDGGIIGTNETYRDPSYDREAMRAILVAFNRQELVETIYFNDEVLIQEGLCEAAEGHDDHAHVRIDPPALERETEQTAQRVMGGGELGIQRLADTDVHVQRQPKDGGTRDTSRTRDGAAQAQTGKPKSIDTIDDFVRFVEAVEKEFPDASRYEIAGELRQMWFADANWRQMVDGQGIMTGQNDQQAFNLESRDPNENPLVKGWDIKNLTSKPDGNGGRETRPTAFDTSMGSARISHVLAGIDASVNGFPKTPDGNSGVFSTGDERHGILKTQSGGVVTDFATWAGDLGQAYARYLYNNVRRFRHSTSLEANVEKKATPEELRGDVHGYAATEVYKSQKVANTDAENREGKVSDILESVYRRGERGGPDIRKRFIQQARADYEQLKEANATSLEDLDISAQTEKDAGAADTSDLKKFVRERVKKFAAIWFAKLAADSSYVNQVGFGLEAQLGMVPGKVHFQILHDANNRYGSEENKLSTLVDYFVENIGTDKESFENGFSVQRNAKAAADTGPAGDTSVPDSVRSVVSSTGQSLDGDIKNSMESRMGASFDDVQIHAGPQAAAACEDISARAFTVGNHVAFNHGEYDPASPEGQHVLAHELAHVRQQTGGAVSMLPQEDGLQIDPDPALEREAEQTAQRVMKGGELGIQRLADTDVHVQRLNEQMVTQDPMQEWAASFDIDEYADKYLDDETDLLEYDEEADAEIITPEAGEQITRGLRKEVPREERGDTDDPSEIDGNMSFAKIEIDDSSFWVAATSGPDKYNETDESNPLIPGPDKDERQFVHTDDSNGLESQSKWCTEQKILENVISQFDPGSEGQIKLFTERDPCKSCEEYVELFEQYYEVEGEKKVEVLISNDPKLEERKERNV